MTVEEKATQLTETFTRSIRNKSGTKWIVDIENGKKDAIACCDFIISEISQLRKPEYATFVIRYATFKEGTTEMLDEGTTCDGYELIGFWEEVKKEISKKK